MTESKLSLTSEDESEQQTATWCCCRRSTGRLAIFFLFFVTYICLGAICFMFIESPAEYKELMILRSKIELFIQNNSCVSESSLKELIREVVLANDKGVTLSHTSDKGLEISPKNWEFGQAVFFAMTVVTTIGYGKTTPLSEFGKAFCLVYALFGIPLMMIMFTALVERIYLPTRAILEWMQLKLIGKCSGLSIRFIHLILAALLIIILFILLPALVFDYLERKWNYFDSVYYCFISLTTIGLGDFIPGENGHVAHRNIYKIITTIYLFFGLTAMLFVLRIVQDVPECDIGKRISTTSDKEETECQSLNDELLTSKTYQSTQ